MEVSKKRDMDDIANIILTDEIGHAYYPNRSILNLNCQVKCNEVE